MGKLLNRLNAQLKRPEHKKDAEKCIKLYNYLKENTDHVWESDWKPLTNIKFVGKYPNKIRYYYPSFIGEAVLKGLNL